MSDVDLIINVHTNGIKDVANLSASVKALTANLREITIPMSKLDTQSRAVNKALGMTNRGMSDHAKTIKGLKENQRALSEESKRLKLNIIAYTGAIRTAGGPTTALGKELTSTKVRLQAMSAAMRGARVRAFGSDIASVSLRMQKMGKDAQFVGRSLMINLTAPIMLFARLGFQSLLKVDKEATRLTKVFDSVAMSAEQAAKKVGVMEGKMPTPDQAIVIEQMVSNYKALDKALTGVSSEFGVSKDIVVGLASEFAELGIVGQDNVVILTELTTTIEKLGGMDIGPAKDLSQALYFNAKRAYEANGAFALVTDARERETMAIKAAITQLNMFNAIENVTALTLQDLADALPEVGSMATAFGLSMTEAAAMLAPMKAAGLDVGASATSIKTSLQRLILPTKKNIDFMDKLAKQYGVTTEATESFKNTTDTGLVGLEAIVDVFSQVKDSSAGVEGALKLMSQLFEKRQGPRMYIAIEQLSMFNKQLKNINSAESDIAKPAEDAIRAYNKLNKTSLKETIDNFKDIGMIARVASGTVGTVVDGYKGAGAGGKLTSTDIGGAKAARTAVADKVREDRKAGRDTFGDVTTEAGKAMLVQLAGPTTAAEIATQELEISLASLSTSVQKIKNNFKLFASEILSNLGPAIKWLSAKMDQFREYWDGLAQSTKDSITRVIGFVLLFLAAIGPVVIAMGTMQASIGVLGRGFALILPKIRNAEGGIVSFGSSAEAARHKIDAFYNKLRNMKSGALGGLSSAGMASMGTLDAAGIAANQASGTVGQAVRAGAAVNLAGNVAPVPEAFAHLAPGSPERAAVVAKNRAARLAHAASGRGAVDQYMRNETQMLGAKGMRVNRAGRVIGPGSKGFVKGGKNLLEDVSQASALRESRFAARGLTRGTGGEVFRTTRKGIERQITENQGMRLARGGIAGKLTSAKLGATEAVRSIGAAPAKAMQGYRNSVLGAKAALRAMRVEQMAVGGGSFIKTAIVAMKGFASATKLGTLALKIMKLVMISTGIGAVIAAIGIAVLLIVKNFDKFKEAGSGAFKTIKEAFTIFVNALKEVARPFLDLFKQFSAGGAKGKSAIGGVAAAFGKIATAVKWIAGLFMKFVKNVIQPYLYAIINIVMFVVSIFTGKWGDAFDFLMAAVSQVAKFTVQGFALLMKAIVTVVFLGVKAIITAFTAIPKAAAKIFGWLGEKTGIGLFTSIGDGINSVVDGLFSLVDSGKSIIFGAIDTVAGALTRSLDKGIKKGIKQSTGAITDFGTDSEDEAEDAGEAIAESAGDGFAEALDLGGAMKKELEDVVQQLQDYVAGELKNAVDKYLTQAENALKKQKEAALKVFEVQITTLDKLEKAQESLTKTMAYESEKRKRIDDKALTDEQYRRNYALAIYEGRVDDARMLQLEQGLDEKSFTEDMKTIETKRSEELAKENLDALKTAINEAKDAAGKFFDESLIKFQEAAALITKFPPITIQDYQDQVGKLHKITTDASLANSTEFGNMFETFVTTINDKMPNKVVGAFSMSLDALVIEAQKKYGLGGNPEDLSIIGVTLGMLAGMGDTFGDEKQTVVDAFGLVSDGLVGNFTAAKTEILRIVDKEFLEPFAESTKTFVAGFQTIYTQAILDGNTSITNSLRNNVTLNKALFDEMNGYLDATTLKWVALKVAADAAKDGGTGGGSDAPGSTGSTGSTGTTNTGGGTKTDPFAYRRDANGNTGFGATSVPTVPKPGIFAPKYAPKSGQAAMSGNALQNMPKTVFVPTSSSQTGFKGYAKGGVIPSRSDESGYIGSGYINAPTQEGVPALLHGGEYIVNAKAVARLGIGALEKLNNNLIPRFAKGGYVAPKKGGIPFGGEDKILANSTKKAPQALQGPYATSIPVIAPPTIHLNSVPIVKNNMPGESARSTVRSASFGVGGGELLLPTVVKGKILSNTNAYNAFANGGYKDHLGLYASTAAANKAAEVIHLSEANRLAQADKLKSQRIITPLPIPSVRGKTIGALPGSGNSGRWQDDTTLNIVDKAIYKGSDILGTVGKFGLGIVDAVAQNAFRVGMTMYNTAAGYTEAVTGTGYSRNPFKNAVHRNTDLFYGRGLVLPGHLFDNMRIAETGTPVDVMWKQISEYEKLSGEKIPLWKKVLASAGGDPVISDTIGVATLGGGSFVNAAVKSTVLRGVESAAGRMLLTTALGEGGAMALTGRVAQAASLAASNRASVVFRNKNLFGRLQSGAARVTGRDIVPVAPELINFNRLIEQKVAYNNPGMMSIAETFGKRPSTIVGDVVSGRMSVPQGGFVPKAGSIGAGSFIDATVAGEGSAATGSYVGRQLALNPGREVKLTMGARGADLSRMIQSGVIDSNLATESGYISNQRFLSELGIVNEEYSSYNFTRSKMQAPDGPLKGNVNYGYARLADDFATAADYRQYHMNIGEAGALYTNQTGAWLRNIQSEIDNVLGGAIIDLKPHAAMTYTEGDSYNMYLRNLLTKNNPAQNLPQYLGDIPLVAEYGDKIITDAAGRYTEIQFPSIPFDSSAIESVTLTRKDLLSYYQPPGTVNVGGQGWGSDYLTIVGPQEQLVMQRELAQQLANLGIKVKTGVNDQIFNESFTKSTLTAKMDPVPLHQIPQDEFDRMLLGITEKLRADQGLPSIPQDVITSDTFNIKTVQDGIKGFIANYRVASSVLKNPEMQDVSAGINRTVLSSMGGKVAKGVKTFGSVFSNLGSNIRYSDAVQSTLNAGSLTLAGLSGRKGLNYGMMATGLKKAPLGISPAQLRSSKFLNDVTPWNKGQSLFDKARSMPEMLNSVSNQFKNSTILPGSAQVGMIDSYMDILNNTGGDSSYGYARSLLIDNGLKSKVGSPDYSYAKHLLSEDLKGILQTYYGHNLFTPALGSVDPSAIPRIVGESIDLYNQQGYSLNATGLRDQAFGRFLAEFDPISSNFIGSEMAPYSWEMNLRKMLTQPKDAQGGFEGNLRSVFRNIQNTAETYPNIAKVQLRELLGNDASIASDFGAKSWLNDTDSITGMPTFGDGSIGFKDNNPYDLLNPGLSRVQKLARQYLLTSNLTDMQDLMNLVRSITEDFSFATTTPGRDLQAYIATSRPELPSFGDIAPYKSSLYVKSRLSKESMSLSSGVTALSGVGSTGGGFGTLNHLVGLDETYNTLWESYRTVSAQVRGINENDNFPLWMPTWEQFDMSWKQTLDDIIEDINSHASVGGSFVGGMLQGGSAKAQEDYLLMLVQKNMHDTWAGPGGTATLNGDLLNLGLGYYDQSSGRTAFDQLSGKQSRGWFYGLRNDRFIQSDRAFSPANSIYDVAAEIAATGVRQFETVGSAGSQAAVIGSTGAGTIGASYRDLTEHALQQLSSYTANVPFNEFKLSEFYLNNAANLGDVSRFTKEGNIQAMLDQASSVSKIPDDFTQLIDDIFGEGEEPSFVSAVWRDWFSTRGTLFRSSTDPTDFTMDTYTQSPFDSKMYKILRQNSDLRQLFNPSSQGYGLNIGAEIVNGEIVANSVNNPKYNPALYHLANRLVDPLKQSLIKTQGYDILQNPIVKGLTGSDILRSRQFADLLQLSNSFEIPVSPLDSIAPDLFSDFDKLNYVSTHGLYSFDFPLSPLEHEWVSRFAEKMLASPLDLSKKISFPEVDGSRTLPGARYPGLSMPGDKRNFKNPSFERELRSTDSWLLALVNDMRQNVSAYGTPVMRERLAFFNYLNEFLTQGTGGGFYEQYFDLRLKNDPNQMEMFNLINDSAKATNMEVLGKETTTFPNVYPGGYTGAFSRSLTATNMLQNKKMAIADVVALYSSNVSNFAQRAAEHSLPLAPLFPDYTNDISPYTEEFVNLSTSTDSSSLKYILKPSELIKLIGDGIKAQGRIGGLLPDSSLLPKDHGLSTIKKRYTDAYGNPRLHDLYPFKTGGYVPGSPSAPFPAMLHGGEYVINADAVRSMGVRTMQSINRSKFNVPSGSPSYSGGGTTSVSTVNINVDTFVGEEEWFKSMMKSYNVNVLPKMNKAAGNESRTFSSYNGIQ